MASFDYITNDELRLSLESDYQELISSMNSNAFKAVHVLSGSIVEAALVDYLIAIDYQVRFNKDPLNMTLEKLIEACKEERIISQRVVDLSTVIRSYRNLIHPARIIRLKDNIDRNSAMVARTLVDIIIEEIATQRKKTYGYTAQQLVDKIERDSSVSPIFEDILTQANRIELERLLILIPQRYYQLEEEVETNEEIETLRRLSECFRMTFGIVSDNIKSKVAGKFIEIVKNSGKQEIQVYGDAFFTANDMRYLPKEDSALIKKHIIHRLPSIIQGYSKLIVGIGHFLEDNEIASFVDVMVKSAMPKDSRDEVVSVFEKEYMNMSDEHRRLSISRINDWISHFNDKPIQTHYLLYLTQVKERLILLDEEIPF